MVKLQGPCFSLGASGSIAQALTYSNWRNRPFVKRHAIPANPNTGAQRGQRVVMGFLQQQWSQNSDADRNTWETIPNPFNLSPYHLYVQYNMNRWANFQAPTRAFPALEVATWGSVSIFTVSNNIPNEIQVTLRLSTINDNWGITLYRSTTTPMPAFPGNTITCHVKIDTLQYIYRDYPLAPGTYYYRIGRFAYDGNFYNSTSTKTGIAL